MSRKKKSPSQNVADSVNGALSQDCVSSRYSVVQQNGDSAVSKIAHEQAVCPFSEIESEVGSVFAPKKQRSLLLADSYSRLWHRTGDDTFTQKSIRVANCGTLLEFRIPLDDQNGELQKPTLHNANFCRDRLCPQCMRRRSLKMYSNMCDILSVMDKDVRFLFLTLTIRNVDGEDLDQALDKIEHGFVDLMRRKNIKKAVLGYFRILEVTINTNKASKSYGTYHPHLHVILAVRNSYFKSRDYIKHADWLKMWRESVGDKDIKFVNIETVKPRDATGSDILGEQLLPDTSLHHAVLEVSKYSVKDADFIFEDDLDFTDEHVLFLSRALRSRRLMSMSGVFREASRKLNQKDAFADDADLLIVSGRDIYNPDLAYVIVRYQWGCGAYHLVGQDILEAVNAERKVV